jgi:hypothetical protein
MSILFGKPTKPNDMTAAFARFHADNPEVYQLVVRFAKEAISRGRTRIGMALIFERIRWHVQVETFGDEFKLNNNFRAYYARLFSRDYPQHAKLFSMRGAEADLVTNLTRAAE